MWQRYRRIYTLENIAYFSSKHLSSSRSVIHCSIVMSMTTFLLLVVTSAAVVTVRASSESSSSESAASLEVCHNYELELELFDPFHVIPGDLKHDFNLCYAHSLTAECYTIVFHRMTCAP